MRNCVSSPAGTITEEAKTVIIRCTQKVARKIKVELPDSSPESTESEWYTNLVRHRGEKFLVSTESNEGAEEDKVHPRRSSGSPRFLAVSPVFPDLLSCKEQPARDEAGIARRAPFGALLTRLTGPVYKTGLLKLAFSVDQYHFRAHTVSFTR
ncbi:MAG: hypothetical protein ACOCSK_00970 [Rhodothermales bacterium]